MSNASTSQTVEDVKSKVADAAVLLTTTEEESAVLKRIEQQRNRLRAHRAAKAQAVALASQSAKEAVAPSVSPDDPFATRLAVFARAHPVFLAIVVGGGLMLGPRKVIRWGSWVLPLVNRWSQRFSK